MKQLMIAMTFATGVAMASPGNASDFSAAFQQELDGGRTAGAIDTARHRLAEAPDDREAQFALGVAQFLSAAEGLGRGLYRFGLRNSYESEVLSLGGLPFLRLPVPDNPDPDPVSYSGLRELLAHFVTDLAEAESTLAAIPPGAIDLPLDLGTIRLDINGDQNGDSAEQLATIFDALNGRAEVAQDLAFNFDDSDVPWLQGYAHLLMAMAEVPLAYDWERAFDATFHGLFPNSDLPNSDMAREMLKVEKELMAFYERPEGPPEYPSPPPKPADMSYFDWTQSETYRNWQESWFNSQEYRDYKAMRRLEENRWLAGIADLVVFIHLFDWPVAEPERAASARAHLLSMISLSRESWRRILAETDDTREWLPAPTQTGRFRNMRVTEDVVAGWHGFLDGLEAVLDGRKLVRHWRFAGSRGVNVRRMFEEPRTLDPVLIVAGPGVLPYLEDGETLGAETVGTLFDVMESGFLAYFIWFN